MSTERPILFSGPMVRAILEGRKTQTRRIVKVQPQVETEGDASWRDAKADLWRNARQYARDCCPYGAPGDYLWVREAWQTGALLDKHDATKIAEMHDGAGFGNLYPNGKSNTPKCPLWYGADDAFRPWGDNDIEDFGERGRRRHARFMPRWAIRITLEITDVRVQRLQEISADDARAEGMESCTPCDQFRALWDSINCKSHPWASNPWVWAITFRRAK